MEALLIALFAIAVLAVIALVRRYNPKDARFLGTPVDFVVFDGLSDGEVRSVAFVEVKTGRSELTGRERQIRNAIRQARVQWIEIRCATGESPVSGLVGQGRLAISSSSG